MHSSRGSRGLSTEESAIDENESGTRNALLTSGRRASRKKERGDSGSRHEAKASTFTSAGGCGLPCLIIRGLWLRRALLLREDEITPHVGLHPCCRCPHARTLAHPVRVAAGYSASQRRQHLCAAFPASLSLGRLCPQYAAFYRTRRAWSAPLPGPGMLTFVPTAGFLRFAPAVASLRVHNLREPCRPSTFAWSGNWARCGCFTLNNLRVTTPLSTDLLGCLQSLQRTALGVVNVCTHHHPPLIRSQATQGQRPSLLSVLRPHCGEQIGYIAQSSFGFVSNGLRTIKQKKQTIANARARLRSHENLLRPIRGEIRHWPLFGAFLTHNCRVFRSMAV
jgi:hypothetical protein